MARGTANHNGDEVELTILGHKIGPTILSAELVETIRELADDLEFETEVDPTILSAELVERIRELADDLEFEQEDPDYD